MEKECPDGTLLSGKQTVMLLPNLYPSSAWPQAVRDFHERPLTHLLPFLSFFLLSIHLIAEGKAHRYLRRLRVSFCSFIVGLVRPDISGCCLL